MILDVATPTYSSGNSVDLDQTSAGIFCGLQRQHAQAVTRFELASYFMGFGFLAFMPVLVGCGRPHRAMGLTLSHESQTQLYHILLLESKLPLWRFLSLLNYHSS